MKIVNIIGGLGNQMFQYAFALSLQHRFPEEKILIDVSHFNYLFVKKIRSANIHNGYEVDNVFPNAKLTKAKVSDLMKVTWYMPNYLLSRVIRRVMPQRKTEYIQPISEIFEYVPTVYDIKGDCYYEGVWESVHHFQNIREQVLYTFAHSEPNKVNKKYIEDMESTDNSVGMHIRRGDYLYSPEFNGICDLGYYTNGINKIVSDGLKHTFYIFSNDIEWCENNIKPLLSGHDVYFVTENIGSMSCWDMFLMSHCKDLIIANSSFSWWGAFLNNRKGRVIAPKKWVNRDAKLDIWLNEWIRI
jgi:hypothetical protein